LLIKILLALGTGLAETSAMAKRGVGIVVVAGFLGFCFPLFAQQTDRADFFRTLNSSDLPFSWLTLSDLQPFAFSGAVVPPLLFSWMETTAPVDVVLPTIIVKAPPGATAYAASLDDSSKEVVDVRRSHSYYAGGEMGALYGRSSGKFGREVEEGYIVGGVGDDKFNITVGAAWEHSSGRVPRFGR
jgi:hypothetical protein